MDWTWSWNKIEVASRKQIHQNLNLKKAWMKYYSQRKGAEGINEIKGNMKLAFEIH